MPCSLTTSTTTTSSNFSGLYAAGHMSYLAAIRLPRFTEGDARMKTASRQPDSGATTGYEAELWAMADTLRGSMDAAEYKHVVLGLVFLKYISDAFEERHAAMLAEWGEDAAEDRDEYIAESIFWVPPEARWLHLKAEARHPILAAPLPGQHPDG